MRNTISNFKSYVPDLPRDLVESGHVVGNSRNFRVQEGFLTSKDGYEKLQTAALSSRPVGFYDFEKLDGTKILIALCTDDVYRWDASAKKFKFLTAIYIVGQVSCAGETTTVEGDAAVTADDWSDEIAAGDYIGFGSNDPDDITTWYRIDSVTDEDTLELTENGPDTDGAVDYVIRKVYTATESLRWECETFYDGTEAKNLLILTNGVDAMLYWDGDTTTPTYLAEITDAPVAKHLAQLGGRLIALNIVSVGGDIGSALPYTYIGSGVADYDGWNDADDALFQEIYNTPTQIMFAEPFLDYLCVAKEDCIAVLQTTQDPDLPISYSVPVRSEGSLLPTAGKLGQFIGIVTNNDIKLFDGTAQLKSIAHGKVRKTILTLLNAESSSVAHSCSFERYKEWRLYLPSTGHTTPDMVWIYNWEDDLWFFDDEAWCGVGTFGFSETTTISELGYLSGDYGPYALAAPAGTYNGTGDSNVKCSGAPDFAGDGIPESGYIEVYDGDGSDYADTYYYSSYDDVNDLFVIAADPEGACPSVLVRDYADTDYCVPTDTTIGDLSLGIDSYGSSSAFEYLIMGDVDNFVYREVPGKKTTASGLDMECVAWVAGGYGQEPGFFDRFLRVDTFYEESGDEDDEIDVSISVDDLRTQTNVQMITNQDEQGKVERHTSSFNKAGKNCLVRIAGRFFRVSRLDVYSEPQGDR